MSEPDVVVHVTTCPLDGRNDKHTHTQAEWRALLDSLDLPWKGKS